MEFESKIASFAGGLFLIGSYMILFGLWEYSVFLLVLSAMILLLVAFRDYKPGRKEAISLMVAFSLIIFFLKEFDNSIEWLEGRKALFELVTRPSFFSHYRNETAAFFLTREFTEEIKLNSPFARHLVIAGTEYGKGKAAYENYIDDYLSGLMDMEKLMDKYLRQNKTPVILEKPSNEWISISSRSEKLDVAITSI
jgi:hypothetical protein